MAVTTLTHIDYTATMTVNNWSSPTHDHLRLGHLGPSVTQEDQGSEVSSPPARAAGYDVTRDLLMTSQSYRYGGGSEHQAVTDGGR